MTPVSWEKVKPFIQEAFEYRGRVDRADCIDLAFARNAEDDVVDALDALGSRVFPNPTAARDFLTQQGYLSP